MKITNTIKDTIAAISTPAGQGGIGIVRISGKKAFLIADKIFKGAKGKKPSKMRTHTIRYGYITQKGSIIDEVLLTVMRAPKTYTREDVVEIGCHGGTAAMKKILEIVILNGARMAEPGEFTKRAFMNGRIDLAQAESVCDVINAKTERSLNVAIEHLEGYFSKEIKAVREELLNVLMKIEADIDFPSEEIDTGSRDTTCSQLEKVRDDLEDMLDTEGSGMLLKEGVTCVICGKPNVGKSSLFNVLLKRNRAIVTHIPGTTRDIIEEVINIEGAAVKIVDTAGIVKSDNIVEKEGIERTKKYIKRADLAIFMLDLSRPFTNKDKTVMKILSGKNVIIAANKSDLKKKISKDNIKELKGKELIEISIVRKRNIAALERSLAKAVWGGKILSSDHVFLNNLRHKKAVLSALKNVKKAIVSLKKNDLPEVTAIEIRESVFELGTITGESIDINILDRIFSKFCIGK